MNAFSPAESDIHSRGGGRAAHDTQTEAEASFQAAQIEILAAAGDFSRLGEHRGVERSPHRYAVLSLEQQQLPVAESEVAKPAQRGLGAVRSDQLLVDAEQIP